MASPLSLFQTAPLSRSLAFASLQIDAPMASETLWGENRLYDAQEAHGGPEEARPDPNGDG